MLQPLTIQESLLRRTLLLRALEDKRRERVQEIEKVSADAFNTKYQRAFARRYREPEPNLQQALVLLFQRHPAILLPQKWVAEYLHVPRRKVELMEYAARCTLLDDRPSLFGHGMLRICRSLPLEPWRLITAKPWDLQP